MEYSGHRRLLSGEKADDEGTGSITGRFSLYLNLWDVKLALKHVGAANLDKPTTEPNRTEGGPAGPLDCNRHKKTSRVRAVSLHP
jgi:hypothetical protein